MTIEESGSITGRDKKYSSFPAIESILELRPTQRPNREIPQVPFLKIMDWIDLAQEGHL
jgi:hypothetical protein